MLLAERETAEGLLVSVCDEACLGETYDDGDISLDVTEEFYAAEAREADADSVVEALQRASVANIVGSESVAVAVEAGLVEEDRVMEIADTKHAQLLWI